MGENTAPKNLRRRRLLYTMFTPIKTNRYDVLNNTVLNTPQPQASSTVQRKSVLESRFNDILSNEKTHKQDVLYENKPMQKKEDSSLGLLDNMSVLTNITVMEDEQKLSRPNTDAELKCARELLQRCSNVKDSCLARDTNKENNANVQNITIDNLRIPHFALSNNTFISELEETRNTNHTMNDVVFEPQEITARSSGINSNTKKQSFPLSKCFKSISFSTDEIMAQCNNDTMAQINNEEFLSGSKMAEQLSTDEAHWKQNHTYCMPVMNTGKQKLDLSSFSGIIGPMELSVESCAGQKVSVSQYFERKSNNIGLLEHEKMLPGLDFCSETPLKSSNLEPLVDSTITTDAAMSTVEPKEQEHMLLPNAARDIDGESIISLSTIIHTLQDVNSGTPRRLVDQLLMAQKMKKNPIIQGNARKETYTLSSDRKSMLATPTGNSNKFDENISLDNFSTKLSLDSKTKVETNNETINIKQGHSTILSPASNKDREKTQSFMDICKEKMLKKEANDKNTTSSFNQDTGMLAADLTLVLQNFKLSYNSKLIVPSYVSSKTSMKSYDNESYNNLNIRKKETKEKISDNTIDCMNADKTIQSDLLNVVIGRNTERLCNCIVGMTNEANIELVNNGDKWITYSLKLIEILGDTQSIKLNIPEDKGLIKPTGTQSTKIEIKVIKMCKPIFVALHIILSDMVAKSKWFMKHMIFVNPEQLELDIICNSDKQELDFQYIIENSAKVLPLTFHNKNSIDVPIQLSILHNGPRIFSVDGPFDGSIKLNESHDELTHLLLKPHEKFIANIKCEKLQSASIDSPQKQPQYWKSKLIICVKCNDTVLLRKEVLLYAQIGTCKINIIDTELPIVVSRQQGKLINIINSGNVATHISVTVVPMEGHPNAAQDFSIKPDNIFLQVGESGSFLIVYKPQISDANFLDNERYAKVKLVAGNNVYHYIVSTEQKSLESERENYLRCHTPNNIVSLSPATSPQSVTSSRSGPFDRNSPVSMISSVAVAGNIIPIRTTHTALVWNSVKTGKSETKEFIIRNMSDNKIKIQIDISDDSKSFKFLGERQTVNTSIVLAMQRQEIKTLAVIFSPYQVGPVVGKITIKHYTREENDSQQPKIIPLYGHGGCSKLRISDTFKDASGKLWLSFGILYSETTTLRANMTLQNIGDLCSFAKIKVVPKVISPTMDSSYHIEPKELILNPKESRRVSIEFYPKKEDFAILQHSEVSHVATINVTYGDEPTRWRIRRLYNKMQKSGESIVNVNEAFKNIVQPICNAFPGEQLIPGLMSIRDSVQNLSDLCTGIHQYEIMLTAEAGADDTLPVHYDNDDSHMYYSLISDTTHMDEAGGISFFAAQTAVEYEIRRPESQEEQFTVTPSTIILNPPIRNEATVTVLSFFNVPQPFQTNLSSSDYLSVVPAEGMLPSKKSFFLKIQCSQRIERNIQAILEIYTENNKQDVLIKVDMKRQ